MMLTLLRKEVRQHWAALLMLAVLTSAGFGLILLANGRTGEAGSVFESLRVFVIFMVVLGALVLCHRLVVVEYSARTQLFLEALPVSRWRMVAVKYGLGLLLLVGIVGFGLALACLLGWRHEALSPRFLAILGARSFSATICAYHFFFLMGFLGRYRLGCYLVAVVAVFAVSELTDLRLERFGPFELLDQRFPYESQHFPAGALETTWILSAVFLVLAFLLALTREGNVAALLAEKMSHREKIFVAAFVIGLFFAVSVLGEKKKRAPFDLHDAVKEERAGVVAKVSAGIAAPDGQAQAQALARHVADELAAVREYLGLPNLPPVFLTRRRDLDAGRYERGELEQASGVHVQANFVAPEFRRDNFMAWLLREVLIVHSDGRANFEPKQWVLDGFANQPGRSTATSAQIQQLSLRALYGVEHGFTQRDLREWRRFRERVGGDVAEGVAWSGLRALDRQAGPERTQRFIRAILGADVPKDVRALLRERSAPMDRLLESEAGLTLDAFWSRWQEELARMRRAWAAELAGLPRLYGEMRFIPTSRDSRRASFRLRIEPPPAQGTRYSLRYHELPVFDEDVAPQSLRREENPYPARATGDLGDTFSRGGRLYWTFTLDVPALGGEVISGWKREEIP